MVHVAKRREWNVEVWREDILEGSLGNLSIGVEGCEDICVAFFLGGRCMVHCIVRMFGRAKGENRGTFDLVRCKGPA
jgi:hypothetical protein